MRSLKASSRRLSIQPLSLFNLRRLWRCRSIPPTIPGTPATLSKKIILTSHFLSVITALWSFPCGLYPVALSVKNLKKRTALKATLSENDSVGRCATIISFMSFSAKLGIRQDLLRLSLSQMQCLTVDAAMPSLSFLFVAYLVREINHCLSLSSLLLSVFSHLGLSVMLLY